MRMLTDGTQKYTQAFSVDERGAGNSCHQYVVKETPVVSDMETKTFATINFQNGPIGEAGINGVHNEDLLVIVLDRLKSFQSGDFKCRENAIALTKLEEALMWLNKRTSERVKRGVEGTYIV